MDLDFRERMDISCSQRLGTYDLPCVRLQGRRESCTEAREGMPVVLVKRRMWCFQLQEASWVFRRHKELQCVLLEGVMAMQFRFDSSSHYIAPEASI